MNKTLDRWVYPRACGGTNLLRFERVYPWGLSPRLRGNDFRTVLQDNAEGSIPALAGERASHGIRILFAGVYPRACGGTLCLSFQAQHERGLSPRLRGNALPVFPGPA